MSVTIKERIVASILTSTEKARLQASLAHDDRPGDAVSYFHGVSPTIYFLRSQTPVKLRVFSFPSSIRRPRLLGRCYVPHCMQELCKEAEPEGPS